MANVHQRYNFSEINMHGGVVALPQDFVRPSPDSLPEKYIIKLIDGDNRDYLIICRASDWRHQLKAEYLKYYGDDVESNLARVKIHKEKLIVPLDLLRILRLDRYARVILFRSDKYVELWKPEDLASELKSGLESEIKATLDEVK